MQMKVAYSYSVLHRVNNSNVKKCLSINKKRCFNLIRNIELMET